MKPSKINRKYKTYNDNVHISQFKQLTRGNIVV